MNAPTGKIEAAPSGLALLRAPFPPNQISKLPKETKKQADDRKADMAKNIWPPKCNVCGGTHHKNAVHLDYVGHAALTDRLLDTDPEWSWEPFSLDERGLPARDQNGGLWIKLTVLGVTRLGYGSADGKSGGDAVKEIIGDALRNAAMRFGAALDLWHKGDLHAEEDGGAESGAGGDNSERQVSPTSTRESAEPQGMPDAEFARIVQLIEATKSNRAALLKHYDIADLRMMGKADYADAVEKLTVKLAGAAKQETNAKASGANADLDADLIPY